MIPHIPATEATFGFVKNFHFERTGEVREKVVECNREELIDLVFYLIKATDDIRGDAENIQSTLDKKLGWTE